MLALACSCCIFSAQGNLRAFLVKHLTEHSASPRYPKVSPVHLEGRVKKGWIMNALLIVHLNIKNPEALKTYREAVGATLAPFGGKPLFSGKVVDVLEGKHDAAATVAITFTDHHAIQNWFDSPAY